jgi:hypothetical protein
MFYTPSRVLWLLLRMTMPPVGKNAGLAIECDPVSKRGFEPSVSIFSRFFSLHDVFISLYYNRLEKSEFRLNRRRIAPEIFL